MDGLMIDSEPYWRKAEIAVFADLGVNISEADCRQIMGMRLDVVVKHFYQKQPWNGPACRDVEHMIIDQMEAYIKSEIQPLSGLHDVLDFARSLDLPIALASSSPMRLIQATVNSLDLSDYFHHIATAEDELHGKPDPAVYLSTANAINTNPANCLVFEDSKPGVAAALAAGMKCIAVPAKENKHLPIFQQAHLLLSSLSEFNQGHFEQMTGT